MSWMQKSQIIIERCHADYHHSNEVNMMLQPRRTIAVHPGEILQEILSTKTRSPSPKLRSD